MKPNQMPSKPSNLRQQLLAGLIETKPTSWSRKEWDDEKKEERTVAVTRDSLKFPLAQNVSSANVDALAKRWIK